MFWKEGMENPMKRHPFFPAVFGIDKYSCWINGMSDISITKGVSPEHFNLLLSPS